MGTAVGCRAAHTNFFVVVVTLPIPPDSFSNSWRMAVFLAFRLALAFVVSSRASVVAAAAPCSADIGAAHDPSCPEHGHNSDVTNLHLLDHERARHGPGHGGGLIEQTITADVLVAGGGSAGTSAAIAAARNGAQVVLVEGSPILGGNSGSATRVTMVGACGPRGSSDHQFKMDCREGGIVEEYQLHSAVHNPDFVPELFSLEILTLVKAEPNLTLYLNTWLVGVTTAPGPKGNKVITSAICEDQHSQRRYIVKAKTYIDATGDGRLGAEAGAEWIQGREGNNNKHLFKL